MPMSLLTLSQIVFDIPFLTHCSEHYSHVNVSNIMYLARSEYPQHLLSAGISHTLPLYHTHTNNNISF